MSFILKMGHQWNQNKNGYLGNSSVIGYYVADDMHSATTFSSLEAIKAFVEEDTNLGAIDIEGVNYIIAEVHEVEMQIKSKRKVNELFQEINKDVPTTFHATESNKH